MRPFPVVTADAVALLAARVDLVLVGFHREDSGHSLETAPWEISDAVGPMSSHVAMETGIVLNDQAIAHRDGTPELDVRIAAVLARGQANSADEVEVVADSVALAVVQAAATATVESTWIPSFRSTMTVCRCGADCWQCRN